MPDSRQQGFQGAQQGQQPNHSGTRTGSANGFGGPAGGAVPNSLSGLNAQTLLAMLGQRRQLQQHIQQQQQNQQDIGGNAAESFGLSTTFNGWTGGGGGQNQAVGSANSSFLSGIGPGVGAGLSADAIAGFIQQQQSTQQNSQLLQALQNQQNHQQLSAQQIQNQLLSQQLQHLQNQSNIHHRAPSNSSATSISSTPANIQNALLTQLARSQQQYHSQQSQFQLPVTSGHNLSRTSTAASVDGGPTTPLSIPSGTPRSSVGSPMIHSLAGSPPANSNPSDTTDTSSFQSFATTQNSATNDFFGTLSSIQARQLQTLMTGIRNPPSSVGSNSANGSNGVSSTYIGSGGATASLQPSVKVSSTQRDGMSVTTTAGGATTSPSSFWDTPFLTTTSSLPPHSPLISSNTSMAQGLTSSVAHLQNLSAESNPLLALFPPTQLPVSTPSPSNLISSSSPNSTSFLSSSKQPSSPALPSDDLAAPFDVDADILGNTSYEDNVVPESPHSVASSAPMSASDWDMEAQSQSFMALLMGSESFESANNIQVLEPQDSTTDSDDAAKEALISARSLESAMEVPPPSTTPPPARRPNALSDRSVTSYVARERHYTTISQLSIDHTQSVSSQIAKHNQATAEEDMKRKRRLDIVKGATEMWNRNSSNAQARAADARGDVFRIATDGRSGRWSGPLGLARRERTGKLWKAMGRGEVQNETALVVPVRIEVETQAGARVRDVLAWNLNDTVVTPELFAQQLCEDLNVPDTRAAVAEVARQVAEQVEDFRMHSAALSRDSLLTLDSGGVENLDEDTFKEHVAEVEGYGMVVGVQINVTIGNLTLTDHIEWDVTSAHGSPESFAEVTARELGLGADFATAIAHQIREQSYAYLKTLVLLGLPPDGSLLPEDDEILEAILPPVPLRKLGARRDPSMVDVWGPKLERCTNGDELLELPKDRTAEREAKRRRVRAIGRMRRGVALPDREPIKTSRTPFGGGHPGVGGAAASGSSQLGRQRRAVAPQGFGYNAEGEMVVLGYGRDIKTSTSIPAIACPDCGIVVIDGLKKWKTDGTLDSRIWCRACSVDQQLVATISRSIDFDPSSVQDHTEISGTFLPPIPRPLTPAQNASSRAVPKPPPQPFSFDPSDVIPDSNLPNWASAARHRIRSEYPDDRFELVLAPEAKSRGVTFRVGVVLDAKEVRMMCEDCPGRLYMTGPANTLGNFETHLKNARHRQSVQVRVEGARWNAGAL
ncbi:SWI/SNF chromatin-remodeling complex subunit [Gonapodya sp. JEL0774]|nr:SWI/SNF chromatin-remodeling complex subunit [Gonapodya sp. JEL0774]